MAGPSAQAKWTPETSILKPIGSAVNSDDWPSFVLTDATVYRADGTTLVNALLVGEEGPFVVRGKLEADEEEDRSHFVRPNIRSAYIEIDASMLYSLGYDPLPLVWVSGRAGWFMITPSSAYTPIYNDICDISVLYHHLLEIYKTAVDSVAKTERSNVYANLSIKHILFEYAVAVGDGVTYDELVDKCVRLAPLLLAHCLRTNDIPWKTTGFYKWLTLEIQDRRRSDRRSSRGVSVPGRRSHASPAATAVPQSLAPPATATPSSPESPCSMFSSTAHPPSSLSQELPLRTPPRLLPPSKTSSAPASISVTARPVAASYAINEDDDRHATVFQLLLEGILEIGHDFPGDLSRISQSHVHGKLYNKFRLKYYTAAKDLSAYFSKELLGTLDHNWLESPYGSWLRTAGAEPFKPVSSDFSIHDMPSQLVRRVVHSAVPRQKQNFTTPSLSTTPQRQHQSQQRSVEKKPLSVVAARRGGKHAALRPPMASKKRPHGRAFLDDNSDKDSNDDEYDIVGSASRDAAASEARGHNSRRRKLAVDDQPDNDEETVDDGSGSNNRNHNPNSRATMLVVRSLPLAQSTAPTGPNRTWRCARPDCSFFVRDAGPNFGVGGNFIDEDDDNNDDDDDESHDHIKIAQELVRQHIRGHEQDTLNKVDLAITEGSRRHVSVGHLLEKIRNMGDKTLDDSRSSSALPPINGAVAPSPIVRRFLV